MYNKLFIEIKMSNSTETLSATSNTFYSTATESKEARPGYKRRLGQFQRKSE